MTPHLARSLQAEVRVALDSHVEPPDVVPGILNDLWVIERSLRWHLQQKARDHFGASWRSDAFHEETRERVVERAWRDAVITTRNIEEIGNPFDWLTLDELISLLEEPWAAVPTCPAVLWRRFLSDVLPVRNRLAHFRLPALDDAATVLRWRRDLVTRLGRAVVPESSLS